MKPRSRFSWHVGIGGAALLAAVATSAPAQERGDDYGRGRRALVIAKQGYFYVGGEYHTAATGTYQSGQAYVEYQIPQRLQHRYPIVMIEGFGLTGTNFKGTADGRDGWEQFFLRQGYAVYTMDQPGRGRAPWITDKYGTPPQPLSVEGTQRGETAPELYNLYPKAHLHTQWPGSGVAGDPIFDDFHASQVPSIGSGIVYEALNRKAAAELLDRIGPAILIGHSQGGLLLWPIADERPSKVKALIALEPGGPPFHGVRLVGPPNWFEDAGLSFPWGITSGPMTYAPAVTDPSELSIVQQSTPDRPDLVRCWRQTEPARTLPTLRGIPILIVSGEASGPATRDHCTSQFLTQAGVTNTHLRLEEVGILGNGHMMMMEKNSDQIAAVIARWIAYSVRGAGRSSR